MPSIDRFNGDRVVIYPNDHRPPHVHAMSQPGEAVFRLQCPRGPVQLREVYGLNRQLVSRIGQELDERHWALCLNWRNIHGYH